MSSSDALSIADTIEVLTRLGDVANSIVLIGGQALNFWAEQFVGRAAALLAEAPYASKDIDFCGTQAQLALCARALNGRPTYQSEKTRSLCIGVVHYLDANRKERELDFLSKPFGLEAERIWEMSFPATVKSQDGREATVRIMHPLHCFMSRVSNVGGLDKYHTDHGLRQMRASILCMRAFLQSQLDAGEHKVVTRLNERIFRFCLESEYAQKVFEQFGVEPFEAALHGDSRQPPMFNARRYPQMKQELAQHRNERRQLEARRKGSTVAPGDYVFVSEGEVGGQRVAYLTDAEGTEVVIRPWKGLPDLEEGASVRLEADGRVVLLAIDMSRGR